MILGISGGLSRVSAVQIAHSHINRMTCYLCDAIWAAWLLLWGWQVAVKAQDGPQEAIHN
jgi:hypothetical protein